MEIDKEIVNSVTKIVDAAEDGVKTVEETVNNAAAPARRSLIKKFPILFTLLVTFGVSATFLGFEQIVLRTALFNNHPSLMLGLGVGILILTGTLYKKLG